LKVLIFTIYIVNSEKRLLPFCRWEPEIKQQKGMPDFTVFQFQARRREHWASIHRRDKIPQGNRFAASPYARLMPET